MGVVKGPINILMFLSQLREAMGCENNCETQSHDEDRYKESRESTKVSVYPERCEKEADRGDEGWE